jgi:hypothetical protein
MKRSTILGLILLATVAANAQSFYTVRRERTLVLNVGVGPANYFGELTNPASLGPLRYGANIGVEKHFGNRLAARVDLNWYQIKGTDEKANSDRVVRNLSFISNNFEASSVLQADLLPNGLRFYQRPTLNFYGFIGVGATLINPKTEYNGEMVALRPLQTENVSYSNIHFIIPVGGGIKVKAGPFFNLALEAGLRKTFTDYLDDVSVRDYPDPATLSSDLSRALSDRSGGLASVRGNPEADDWYFMIMAKVQYYLPIDFGNSKRKLYTQKRKAYKMNKKPRRR